MRERRPAPRPAWWRWFPVWRRNLLVWRKLALASLFGNFGEPLLYLLALGYGLGAMVGPIDGLPYLHFLASGIVCSSSMMTASFESGRSMPALHPLESTTASRAISRPRSVSSVPGLPI